LNGTFPSSEKQLGLTIRAFDPASGLLSFAWLDNFIPPDFTTLIERFENGIGVFEHVIEATDGRPLKERFIWTFNSENARRWEQAFSLDDGVTWDTNWIMEFNRRSTV
jgi:hypothetical protein